MRALDRTSHALVVILLSGFTQLFAAAFADSQGNEATDSQVVSLLHEIANQSIPESLKRNDKGEPVFLWLGSKLANNQNLNLVSMLGSLQDLAISGIPNRQLTKEGFASLARLTNLVSLRLVCINKLNEGILGEICKLRELRRLQLTAIIPPENEYYGLTNLQNLAELTLTYDRNFGDKHLSVLTNLSKLKSLTICYNDTVTKAGTNVLSNMTGLTNVVIKIKK